MCLIFVKYLDFPFYSANTYLSETVGSGFINLGDKYIFVKYDKGRYSLQPVRFNKVSEFHEGLALVQGENEMMYYLNPDGSVALSLPKFCSAAGNFSEGKAWVCFNGKYGYINKKGKLIIDTVFSYTSDFNNGIAYVAYGGRQGVIKPADRYEQYPDLRIDSITIHDENRNSKVESGETFLVEVTLTNYGNDEVRDINLVLTGKSGQSSWFSYGSNQLHTDLIEPGKSKSLSFKGTANMDLVSEDILINIKAEADKVREAGGLYEKAVDSLIPRSRKEKRWFTLTALAAGVCEEVVFRGFFLYLLGETFPAASPYLLAVMAGVLFGVAHFYQGIKGAIKTSLIGVLFGTLYLWMNSLLLCVLLHILFDVSSAFLYESEE